MIKVVLETVVVDALVNCLETWISCVPLGAEKKVGQWIKRGRQGVWGYRARLAGMMSQAQLTRVIWNVSFHLTSFNTYPTLVLFRVWYFKCRCQHHLAQTRQKSSPLRWWCDLHEEVVGAFALRSSVRCSLHHLLTSTTLSVLHAATPATRLNTNLRTSFLYQHGSSRNRTLWLILVWAVHRRSLLR